VAVAKKIKKAFKKAILGTTWLSISLILWFVVFLFVAAIANQSAAQSAKATTKCVSTID
jgi:ABC-type polysaccharide/polyol phosphate export permease